MKHFVASRGTVIYNLKIKLLIYNLKIILLMCRELPPNQIKNRILVFQISFDKTIKISMTIQKLMNRYLNKLLFTYVNIIYSLTFYCYRYVANIKAIDEFQRKHFCYYSILS